MKIVVMLTAIRSHLLSELTHLHVTSCCIMHVLRLNRCLLDFGKIHGVDLHLHVFNLMMGCLVCVL